MVGSAIGRQFALCLFLGIAAWKTMSGVAAEPQSAPTKVVLVTPRNGATGVDVQAIVQVHFSNGLTLTSFTADSVRLLDDSGTPVAAQRGSDLEADVVNLQPDERLSPRSTYTLEVLDTLLDKEGVAVEPHRSSFTTGEDSGAPLPAEGFQFSRTSVDEEQGPTAIAVGPDGHLYVCTYYGIVFRLQISPETGLSIGKESLLTLEGRKILGLAFDPEADPSNLVAWITYDDRQAEQLDTGTFSGVASRLLIPPVGSDAGVVETQVIVGLPSGWHPLNGCTFGPDKRLYISVGSMNRLGHDPLRPETLLSAAVLAADVRSADFGGGNLPVNVQTAAPVNYDPFAATAPVKLYATGFREMYRPCWLTNGNLYGGVNQNDGTGRADTPSNPGVPSLSAVFPDEDLVRIVEGGYYGHPNASRGEYVLLGGNPTAGFDPWEVPEYPVGVLPDDDFNPGNLIFNLTYINGTSANGAVEYTLPGPLQGRLLMCLFEGTHTLHTFALDEAGTAVVDHGPLVDMNNKSLRFTQPLDVTVHPNGRIYVADFGDWSSFGGGGAIWVLNPSAEE